MLNEPFPVVPANEKIMAVEVGVVIFFGPLTVNMMGQRFPAFCATV
jgi:hypothetical protein